MSVKADYLFAPVGGGGLLSGISTAFKESGENNKNDKC